MKLFIALILSLGISGFSLAKPAKAPSKIDVTRLHPKDLSNMLINKNCDKSMKRVDLVNSMTSGKFSCNQGMTISVYTNGSVSIFKTSTEEEQEVVSVNKNPSQKEISNLVFAKYKESEEYKSSQVQPVPLNTKDKTKEAKAKRKKAIEELLLN